MQINNYIAYTYDLHTEKKNILKVEGQPNPHSKTFSPNTKRKKKRLMSC